MTNSPERSQPICYGLPALCCFRSICCPSNRFLQVFQLLARTLQAAVCGTASSLEEEVGQAKLCLPSRERMNAHRAACTLRLGARWAWVRMACCCRSLLVHVRRSCRRKTNYRIPIRAMSLADCGDISTAKERVDRLQV